MKAGKIGVGIVLCVAALLLTGCGGGSGTSSDASKTTGAADREAFVAQANKICTRASEDRATAVERSLIATSKEGLSTAEEQTRVGLEAVLPHEEKMVNELRALHPPAGDEAEIEKIIALYEKGLAELKAEPRIAFTGVVRSGVDQMVVAYGLSDECAI